MFQIDLTGAREFESFEAVPPGKYVVEISGVQQVTSSKGLPGIRLEMTILYPLELMGSTDPNAVIGRRLWDSFYQDAQAVGPSRFRQAFLALGFPPEELDGLFQFDEADVIGRTAVVTTRVRTYEGRNYARVTLWEPHVEEDA